MQITQLHTLKGLNQDDDKRFTQEGSYRFAQNIRVASTENGNRSAAQPIKGNNEVSDYKVWNSGQQQYESSVLPTGINTCIGVHEDRKTSSIFCFIYNDTGTHVIYQHKLIEGESIELLRSSTLNFQKNELITGTAFNNNILYWTDGYNPIRQLDILESKNLSTPITEDQISFAKIAPSRPPLTTLTNLTTVDENALKSHTSIFYYRYKFKDNSISPLSPASFKVISVKENASGDILSVYNTVTIEIYYPESNVTDLISGSEILLKRSQTENLKVVASLDYQNGINTVSHTFNNNGFDFTLDTNASNKFSESIPTLSGALTLAKDKIILGNNTEDYDAQNIKGGEVSAIINKESRESISGDNQSSNSYGWGIMLFDKFRRNVGVSPFDNISLNESLPLENNGKDRENYELYYNFDLTNATPPPDWATHYSLVRTANRKKSTFTQMYVNGGAIGKKDDNSEERIQPGQVQKWIIGNNRLIGENAVFTAYRSVGDKIRLKGYDTIYTVTAIESDTFLRVDKDLPKVTNYVDYFLVGSGTNLLDNTTSSIKVDISQMINIGLGYNFNKGDRAWIPMFDLDSEVLSQDGNIISIKWRDKGENFNTDREEYKTLLIEFYTPTSSSDADLYYETGVTYDIINGNYGTKIFSYKSDICDRFSKGELDFKKAELNFSDLYKTGHLQSSNPNNDNPGFIVNDLGRVSATILDSNKTNRETSLRYSNSFVANTKINGLSEFEALNEETLPTEIGKIEKIIVASNVQAEGSVLLTVAQNEIVSVYLQEAIYKDTSGNTTVAVTDKFIGAFNILQKGLGTYNPESVYQIDGRVYGYDSKKGVVWRYAQDGLSRISDRGMQSYFFNKGVPMYKDIEESRAYGSFDYFNGEYVLSLGKPSDGSMETIAYSENANAWTSFFDYRDVNEKTPEMFGSLNNNFYSMILGKMFLHDSNELRNLLYGVQRSSKISLIGNINPNSTKIIQHIEEDSDLPWAIVKIETDKGQETNMTSDHFRTYEDVHCVNILRDINSKAIQSPKTPIIHGDRLRDKTFKITLETNDTVENNLYTVNSFYSESKR